jgi:Concanavalin A-like lectin/glucanases superfamily
MVLPSTGPISLKSIMLEFASTSNLSDHFNGGQFVNASSSIPIKSSGIKLSLSQFLGAGTISPAVTMLTNTGNSLSVSWTSNLSANGYIVREVNTQSSVTVPPSTTNYTFTNLTPGQIMSILVTSFNSNMVYSIPSSLPLLFTVPMPVPYLVHLDASTLTGGVNSPVTTWTGSDATYNFTGAPAGTPPTLVVSGTRKYVHFNTLLQQYFFTPTINFVGLPTNGLTTFIVFQRTQACNYSRLYDFGNGAGNQNIMAMWIGSSDTIVPAMYSNFGEIRFSVALTNAANWMVLCGVYNPADKTYTMYIDNVIVPCTNSNLATYTNLQFASRTTNLNYIGKSNWNDAYADMNMAELMVIDRCMTSTEITSMNTSLKTKWGI